MSIEKFCSIDEKKTMYAVTGVSNFNDALNYVCRYKKANKTEFLRTHNVCLGTIYNNQLYVGDFNNKYKSNCVIVFRNTINVKKYA